jgi:polysaccharide biosynthesis transport protein
LGDECASKTKEEGSSVAYNKSTYDTLLVDFFPTLRRRKSVVLLMLALAVAAALAFHFIVGQRYESYVLLRVGQGIKDRSSNNVSNLFDGVDLTARIDSVARIGMTDYVVRQAANQVGLDRFSKGDSSGLTSRIREKWTDWLQVSPGWAYLFKTSAPSAAEAAREPQTDGTSLSASNLAEVLRDQISARQEGRSDIMRIAFRDSDPVRAADFVNNLSNVLVANYADVTQVPGADFFFQQQTKRLEEEAEKAAAELQAFSIDASICSVADQRSLLLKRLSELASQLASVRGSIEEKKGHKQAIMDQLLLLRPVYQSKTVSGIVRNLGGRDYKPDRAITEETSTNYGELPPLLLVKVYQDNMSALMKVNADLVGSVNLEKTIGTEIERVNAEMVSLASKEAEYDRLRRVLTRASAAAENYGSRTIEEKISSDIAKKAQLSSVRVVQNAEIPLAPVFPKTLHLAILALLGGLGSGTALALLLELAAVRSANETRRNGSGQVVSHIYRRRLNEATASPAE